MPLFYSPQRAPEISRQIGYSLSYHGDIINVSTNIKSSRMLNIVVYYHYSYLFPSLK